jgi:hypothetical protein
MTNDAGKSDSSVLPGKPPNKAGQSATEVVEGRGLAKGNPSESNTHRTQSRDNVPSALERIRQAARKDRKQRFTSLLHTCTTSTACAWRTSLPSETQPPA